MDECPLRIQAVCDVVPGRADESADFLEKAYAKKNCSQQIQRFDDYKKLCDDPSIDFIWITTPTYFHREPCNYALSLGKKVYLDKPISVTLEDSRKILAAEEEFHNPLIMGFTRRYERSWREAKDILESGELGALQMMQLRSVIPYSRYFHLWHRKNERSGGAFNDKCSHHFDVLNWFASSKPKRISALGGRSSIFKEDPTAPLRCRDCERDECDYNLYKGYELEELKMESMPSSYFEGSHEEALMDNCVYKPGADILDHAICSVEYENGIKASLFFSIFGPKAIDQETLELIGEKGRLILNRGTGELNLVSEFGKKQKIIDTRTAEFETSHFGADLELMRDMVAFCKGERPVVSAKEGHLSLEMIQAANQSMQNESAPQLLKV